MSGTNQHYQPAALIGGFGRPAPSGKPREARVAVRRKATGAVDPGFPKAEKLAYRPGMYRLANPPAGVDRDVVDKLWDPVETGLRDLAARLAARRLQPGDDQLLFDYAATAGVRHPSFQAVAADYQALQGMAALQGDDVQYARARARQPASGDADMAMAGTTQSRRRTQVHDHRPGLDVCRHGGLADPRAAPPDGTAGCDPRLPRRPPVLLQNSPQVL
jgi:hypothetical protein